jgi:hypothetical protein
MVDSFTKLSNHAPFSSFVVLITSFVAAVVIFVCEVCYIAGMAQWYDDGK